MDLDESFSSESSVDSDEEVNIFCIYSTTIHIAKRSKENRQLVENASCSTASSRGFIAELTTIVILFSVTRSICSWKVKARIES